MANDLAIINNCESARPRPAIDRASFLLVHEVALKRGKLEDVLVSSKGAELLRLGEKMSQNILSSSQNLALDHCRTRPLAELKSITLAEMQVPLLHKGFSLACRVLTKPIVAIGKKA